MTLKIKHFMNNVFIAIVSESETIGQIMGREELELKRNDSGSGYPGSGCLGQWQVIILASNYISDICTYANSTSNA